MGISTAIGSVLEPGNRKKENYGMFIRKDLLMLRVYFNCTFEIQMS